MDKRIKYKINDYSEKKVSNLSRFSIAYSGKKMDNHEASYEIVSALKKDSDIIMELNSTLMGVSENDKYLLHSKFLQELDSRGIEYKNKKISVNARRVIFSIPLEGKKIDGFELYARIPGEIWHEPRFKNIIPASGVRYYMLQTDSESNLNAFVELSEDEKIDLCKLVIFDNIALGSMGINTTALSINDLKDMLEG